MVLVLIRMMFKLSGCYLIKQHLFDEICSGFKEFGKRPHDKIYFNVLHIGSKALQHWLTAIYLASVYLSAISV
jgi:hypothetical protein